MGTMGTDLFEYDIEEGDSPEDGPLFDIVFK